MLMLRFIVFLCLVDLFFADKLVVDNTQFTYLTDEDFLNARIQKLQELSHKTRSKRSSRSKYEEWKRKNAAEEAEFNFERFEGDIMQINGKEGPEVNKYQSTEVVVGSKPTNGVLRNAIRSKNRLWHTTKIPYQISTQYKSSERAKIAAAIDEYSENTCIEFIPRTSEKDYLRIIPGKGCYSDVGRAGGAQTLSLGTGCLYKVGTAIHELMHSLGFFHEQSRTDRDDWIEIIFANVKPGYAGQFQKYSSKVLNNQSIGEQLHKSMTVHNITDLTEYNYGSIMHYPSTAFSKNGKLPTIVPKKAGVKIGQRNGFSSVDIQKINKLYCNSQTPSGNPSPAPSPVPAPNPSTCKDSRFDCSSLESRFKLCKAMPETMNRICAKTCNQKCTDESGGNSPNLPKPCKDKLKECSFYLSQGYCHNSRVRNYMSSNCMKSCDACPK